MKIGVTTTNENRKIRTKFFGGTIHAVECACCCYAEVRSVTASLSHVGYLPFTCEGSEPPPTDTRYLKYRASGDACIDCGVALKHQNVTQEWEVDPFTGLTCYNGPESNIVSIGCDELQNCSATQKSYSCAFEGEPNNLCYPTQGGSINWTESLQDSYTIEDVASNVDTVLGRIDPYGNEGMPAGTRGSVVNGTNSSILTWVNECALNRAEYISGAGGVTKTKLFVKFTKDTQYTLTQSNGSVQTLNATEGQEIIVETPSEPNTWTDIAIVNKTKVGCCNSSIGATTHTGETNDSTFVADEDAPPPPTPCSFTDPEGDPCQLFGTRITTTTQSAFRTFDLSCIDEEGESTSGFDSKGTSSMNATIITTDTCEGGSIQTSTQQSGSSNSSSLVYFCPDEDAVIGTSSCSSTLTNDGWSGSIRETYEVYGDDTEIYTISTPCIEPTETTTTVTYSNPINPNQFIPQQNGTWEDETSPNESLCASRTESETTKQSKNVAASVELTFTAPASESPITYEHWFHYYTVEVDSPEEGCPTSDVVAHNEKWTSVSSGGVLTLSRNINLSTPPKDHSICAQGLAFVTRVAS
jgi:hypothetical protein